MDTFEVTEKAVSQRKNCYIQLFASDAGFMYVYPMRKKTEILLLLLKLLPKRLEFLRF